MAQDDPQIRRLVLKYEAILPKLQKRNMTTLIREYFNSPEHLDLYTTPPSNNFVFGAQNTPAFGSTIQANVRVQYTEKTFDVLKQYLYFPEFTKKDFEAAMVANIHLVKAYESFYSYLIKDGMTPTPIIELTRDNILQKAFEYICLNTGKVDVDETEDDIVYVLQLMLSSGDYELSPEFNDSKLNLQEAQTQFIKMMSPNDISYDEVISMVFGNA